MNEYMENADYKRIELILDYLDTSAARLAREVKGINSPQIFYDIKAGKCGISRKLAKALSDFAPGLNYEWVLTGKGEMITSTTQEPDDPMKTYIFCFYEFLADEFCHFVKTYERKHTREKNPLAQKKLEDDFYKTFSPYVKMLVDLKRTYIKFDNEHFALLDENKTEKPGNSAEDL